MYDIAYQLGTVTSPGGAIVAWAVCFVGMLLFVLSLQNLLQKEPGGRWHVLLCPKSSSVLWVSL